MKNYTKGEWMFAENHIKGNHFQYTILSNGSTVICDVMRHNFKNVGKDKFKTPKKLHPCKESKSNANLICNAVNFTAGKSINPESVPDLLEALKEAKKTIRGWHGMGVHDEAVEKTMWDIYEANSPEMKRINSAIEKTKL